MLWASLLRTLYMNKPLLYSSCLCRFIILISLNFWSVVRVVPGKINFAALLRREFNLFLRILLHPSRPHDLRIIIVSLKMGIEEVSWCRCIQCTLVLTEERLVSKPFCIHYQYVGSNEAYCLWLYLKPVFGNLTSFRPAQNEVER